MSAPRTTTLRVDRYVLATIASDKSILEALLPVSQSIKGIRSTDALLARLLEGIFAVIPAERGAVLLAGRKAGDLEPAAFRPTEFNVDPVMPARAFRERVALVVDVPNSILCVPLGDSDLGVVYVDSGKAKAFTPRDAQLLIAIAAEVAVPLDYTRHIERLEGENEEFREYNYINHGIVGESQPIREIHSIIKKVAPLESTVLILGESGTGKDLVARAIHANSPRSQGPFMAINCAAIPETLIESELFGHERGAFSGAVALKKGKLEAASGGTVFLDEVAELNERTQASLLRVLQEGEFQRVGGTRTLHTDVRVVAATNRDIKKWVETGRFRDDLYYRLNPIEFHTPSLRDRREDIPLLAQHFLGKFRHYPHVPKGFSADALAVLSRFAWPGNVRQLHNAVEHAVAFCESEWIEPEVLPRAVTEVNPTKTAATTYEARLEEFVKEMIEGALTSAGGNHAEAARSLGISPSYMRRRVSKFNLNLP